MNSLPKVNFIETREYRRFTEFCDACRQYRYIGLCYGPPGVGKTLSARRYSQWDTVEAYESYSASAPLLPEVLGSDAIFYTPNVLNGPGLIFRDIDRIRRHLLNIALGGIYREEETVRAEVRRRHEEYWDNYVVGKKWLALPPGTTMPEPEPSLYEIGKEYEAKRDAALDPTRLILVDEADRLKVGSLEQMRAIFDQGGIGLVLIGMPGIEKMLSRYPQLYSRVGFVHEYRPLSTEEVRHLLKSWLPPEITLPATGLTDEEALAAIIRITGGNFRLLHRLLSQIARLMEINGMKTVTRPVVEAARETLVIGHT